tara:strand:+ start:41 stop:511 length:471 start_codon:yes stop_codon:yes gene_type:complete
MKFAILLVALLALAGCMDTRTQVNPQGAAMPSMQTLSSTGFGGALNAQRAANGRAALNADSRLAAAAQAHAADMAATGFFSHRGSNGSTMGQRITAQGYGKCVMAENIASGQQSEAEVLTTWMNSPGHRANILDPKMRAYGLGRSGTIWVLDLGGC